VGEPSSVLPPLAGETVARDIGDRIYERLADLRPGRAPIDSSAYAPGLASRWERVDPLTWRFYLRSGARWSDGEPVTAEDVVFSFKAFTDSILDAPARPYLQGKLIVSSEGREAVLIRFTKAYPEQLYDATYHVRIIPRHIWTAIPSGAWAGDTALSHLVGSGSYRLTEWRRGQHAILEASPTTERQPTIRRVVWRFAADPDAALDLILSHEADLLETVNGAARLGRVRGDTALVAVSYPSAAYGFLGFQIEGPGGRPHPVLGDRSIRRALTLAVDRQAVARAVFGDEAKVPPGPMSQLLWIWDDQIQVLGQDLAEAQRLLDLAGWRRGSGGVWRRGGRPLAFDILVPGTSPSRKQLAEALQEGWHQIGVKVSVTAVDFPAFQQRLAHGQFDSYIGAWLDEPSPRGLAEQWTRAGRDALNFGHYANPRFDSLFRRAVAEEDLVQARLAWREAMDTLNADAPALFLYAPTNVAAASKRIRGLTIDPYAWLNGLTGWSLSPPASP
jgi:peptide/nickel transport system substrate-binding protein